MKNDLSELGRRERQIMDIVIRRGRATVAEVLAGLADPPSYSAVRSMLRLLETNQFLRHAWTGPRSVYRPADDPLQVRRRATRHFLRTFFDGSMESAVAAMLGVSEKPPSEAELDRLASLIEQARLTKRGRRSR